MSRLSRRAFVSAVLSTSALGLAPRLARARPRATTGRVAGPSKLIQISLLGGIDDLSSMDPKEPYEVMDRIRPVYPAAEFAQFGDLRLAPSWACLQPHMSRMQVIKGIQVSTVAHPIGERQLLQLRREPSIASLAEPSFVTLAGECMAPDAVLHAVSLGSESPTTGRNFLDERARCLTELHKIANDEVLRDTARAALASAARTNSSMDNRAAFEISSMLLDKLRGTKLPVVPPDARISLDVVPPGWRDRFLRADGIDFSWALHLLANDVARAVAFSPLPFWDTHSNNGAIQPPAARQFALYLKYLLDALDRTPGKDGRPLAEEVGIVILSELGRFPYTNPFGGKDHFPQISVTLFGPGLKPGVFGETGREMMGAEVSPRTGRPGKDGVLLTLDDLGRTMLEWTGHPDPRQLGYGGRLLEFCFA